MAKTKQVETEEKPKRLPALKQPLLGRPDPIEPAKIVACSREDYDLLISLGFQAVRSTNDMIVFDKKIPLTDHKEPCQVSIRCENKNWQCTLVFVWNTWDHTHDAFFSAKHHSLKDLMKRLQFTFKTAQEFWDSIGTIG